VCVCVCVCVRVSVFVPVCVCMLVGVYQHTRWENCQPNPKIWNEERTAKVKVFFAGASKQACRICCHERIQPSLKQRSPLILESFQGSEKLTEGRAKLQDSLCAVRFQGKKLKKQTIWARYGSQGWQAMNRDFFSCTSTGQLDQENLFGLPITCVW
jgi:hypothetical protein